MIISPFTPLLFSHHKRDGIDSRYIQTFAPTDQILIELICAPNEEEGDWELYSEPNHTLLTVIETSVWAINELTEVRFAVLSPSAGYYSIKINGMTSNVFRITDDLVILNNTTLIQYSMNNNRHRKDVVFFIDGMQRFFDFRVPGGFKDSNWSFAVEGEQFITDESDIVQLYGLDSTQKKFTLGNSEGCPVWFAELLNRILCCSYVYFDGERYARKDNSVPETTVLLEGINSFVFTQNLQKVVNLDPTLTLRHQALMRRIDNTDYRLATTNINRLIK
jgi:hypothetical protein